MVYNAHIIMTHAGCISVIHCKYGRYLSRMVDFCSQGICVRGMLEISRFNCAYEFDYRRTATKFEPTKIL